ncbi:FAD binding domain-containing protein [Nocardioides plantarum]|uniref:FAD binding domain-containing protein n=1 Tax=Nocardioides plantarum TaxID=29299 RepID=A0ABV5K732_9ACTN|nr:FAD binding domain-containing protein [Nocardioides plantarum]
MLTEVHVPDDLSEAVRLVGGGAGVLSGGTSVMPRLNDHASPPTELVSLRRVGLAGVRVDGTTVRIGATTTLAQVEHDDRIAFLSPVVRSIASVPVRSLATVGGNLFARQPYGDLTVALVALDARASVADASGVREEAVDTLVGQHHGVVTEVLLEAPAPGTFRYLKATRRRFNSASIVTVAAVVEQHDGVVSAVRVALGGVGPQIVRAVAVETALVGRPLDEDAVAAAAQAGLGELAPADDAYASAWYRARVFPVHLRRALLGR